MNPTSHPIFQQAGAAINSSRKVMVHVPHNQLTPAQQSEYLKQKFGLYHGSNKPKKSKKKKR